MNTIVISIIGALLIVFVIYAYNKGIALRNYVREAFSTMDVYLKKRWDLIPNLVESVKGYVGYEDSVLTQLTELRNLNYNNMSNAQKIDTNAQLNLGLSKLIAVAENYPDLKASQNFGYLMDDLSSIETDIANSRKYYNATVREYNNYTEFFPTNIIASMFSFRAEKMFEIPDIERQNVRVKF